VKEEFFFFEKKKQKTFVWWDRHAGQGGGVSQRTFLGSFFQKRPLS
jgi:hypothetical protein